MNNGTLLWGLHEVLWAHRFKMPHVVWGNTAPRF
jgi:hypothetical protein